MRAYALASSVAKEQAIKTNINAIFSKTQEYINIVLGSIAGVLVVVIAIIAAWAFFKAGKTDSEEERQGQLRKIKWIGIFFIAVIIIWAISPAVIALLQSTWGVSTPKPTR
ncbi:Mbov_0395 family pilin-like conjugal transfer protein [Mycoplasmopsis columbinasalis]|uniref:Uncharacterized protein n=1 Tax=Mycoplasmopsis columbinasalis TaxID=114880 RepID=A0A449BAN4_9BACT|nr:hypothetical protein [Mycoplasmopsis columbinasalis]VEU78253.1 Uncharacterised protein [Mycoplasmopsis columbinasalis]